MTKFYDDDDADARKHGGINWAGRREGTQLSIDRSLRGLADKQNQHGLSSCAQLMGSAHGLSMGSETGTVGGGTSRPL